MKKRKMIIALLLTVGLLLNSASTVFALPPLPSSFYGTVKVAGANVPSDASVSARINGVQYAAAVVELYNGDTVYKLDVPGDDPSTPGVIEGGVAGNTVTFYINGIQADQSASWQSGINAPLDLTTTAINHLPTAADNTVTTIENTDRVFAAANFNFSDVDPGDSLSQVQVTTLESAGALYLDGNASGSIDSGEDITLGQAIPVADIPTLKFKPDPDASGSPYATFGFKVHDGKDYSLNACAMTINVTPLPHTLKTTFKSTGYLDGWVLESRETSNTGGSVNVKSKNFQLGDDARNRQYKALLSFNTSSLSADATIASAVLRIKPFGLPIGSNPFLIFGRLWADICNGTFGLAALEAGDFQAPATVRKVGAFGKIPVGGWHSLTLNTAGIGSINKTGITQFRLYFAKDDNHNSRADLIRFVSGNSATGKPELVITYTVP